MTEEEHYASAWREYLLDPGLIGVLRDNSPTLPTGLKNL
jgi:hypothetical protein